MSHELSVTIERDNRFYNVSGLTGEVLKPKFPFEKKSYDTLEEAVESAGKRSSKFSSEMGFMPLETGEQKGFVPLGARTQTGFTPIEPIQKPSLISKVKNVASDYLGDVKEGWKTILKNPEQAASEILKMPGIEQTVGLAEAAGTLISIPVLFPGIVSYALARQQTRLLERDETIDKWDWQETREDLEKAFETIVYQPKTETGQKLIEPIAMLFEKAQGVAESLGGSEQEKARNVVLFNALLAVSPTLKAPIIKATKVPVKIVKGVAETIRNRKALIELDKIAKEEITMSEASSILEQPKPKAEGVKGFKPIEEEVAFTSQLSEVQTPQPIPAEGGIPAEGVVKRSTIIRELSEKFDVPIRTGKFRRILALGIYKVVPRVIRSKMANDLPVIAHEIGHHLEQLGVVTKQELRGHVSELGAIATKGGKASEGFAEYMRRYISDEAKAATDTPKFHAFFEEKLKSDPVTKEALLKARKDYKRWIGQPSTARILSQISINEKKPRTSLLDKIRKTYTATLDDLNALNVAVKEMTKGERIPFSENPYILARLFRGVWGKIDHFLDRSPFDFKTYKNIPDTKPLSNILKPIKKDLDNFRVYMVARDTLHRKGVRGKETGIGIEDAKMAIREIETAKFKEAFNDLQKYEDSLLKYLLDSEVLSALSFVKIKRAVKDHVPLYRVMEEAGGSAGGKGFANLFDPVKRAKGSGRDIIDPLESIIKNTYAFINIAERNAVGVSLAKLADKSRGGGKFAERIDTPIKSVPITNTELYAIFNKFKNWKETTTYQKFEKSFKEKVGIKEDGTLSKPMEKLEQIVRESLKSRGFTEGEANVYIGKLKASKSGKEVNEVVSTIIEKQTVIHTIKEMELDIPEIVNIFKPSRTIPKDAPIVTIHRKGKPIFYQLSPELHKAMLSLSRENVNMLTKFLSKPARLLRAGATLAPEFALRNPLRDQFTALVQSRYGFIPGVDFTRGLFHALKKNDLYWDFKKSGAEHSMLVSMDRDYLQQNLKDILSGDSPFLPETIRPSIIRHPIEMLRVLSEFGETATRLGEFRKGRLKEGVTKEGLAKAGFAAREVTIDFARMGTKTQAMNMITAFFNANLQGMDKMVRAFKENPTRATAKAIASITMPSILLYMANHDDPRYNELPRWQKDLFWIILTENNIYRIPKPFQLGVVFGSFPERILEYMKTKDPKGFKDTAITFMETSSPLQLPTFSVPIIENFANWSLFLDRPIVPKYAEDLEPGLQAKGYNAEVIKALGESVNYSPAKIENLIRGYTGGLGLLALQGVDEIFRRSGVVELPERPKRGIADIPGLRGFVVRYPTANTQSIQDFYNQYSKSRIAVRTYNFLEDSGAEKKASNYYKKHEIDLELSEPLSSTNRELGEYHKFIRELYNDRRMSAEDKRKLIDTSYLEMLEIAKEANEYIDAIKDEQKPIESGFIPL